MTRFRRFRLVAWAVILMVVTTIFVMRLLDPTVGVTVREGRADGRGFRIELFAENGEPVRYNACKPVHYVINPAGAPPQGVQDVHTAIQMTAEASGLRFVYDGTTEEVPDPDRDPYQLDRYGNRWAPVVIGWTKGIPGPPIHGDEGERPIAAAGSEWRANDEGQPVYVSGGVAFDVTVTDLKEGFGGHTWGQAMLHELGHVLGLGHVDDPASVMNARIGLRAAAWGPGDRAGLWELGLGSTCLATPATP